MYKVGITGGIGSGKSTVCDMLAERGVAVYIADSEAKRLMSSDETLRRDIVGLFGEEAYLGGELNREFLASRVFCDGEALQRLNSVVHPAVMRDFAAWAEAQAGDYVVLESAILFEAGLDDRVDATVAVMSPVELRLKRAMRRDGAVREKIEERMRHQLSDDERLERAKYAIVNISLDDLEEDVEQLHRRLSYDAHRA
jgi:dephospho-CoA kinase